MKTTETKLIFPEFDSLAEYVRLEAINIEAGVKGDKGDKGDPGDITYLHMNCYIDDSGYLIFNVNQTALDIFNITLENKNLIIEYYDN